MIRKRKEGKSKRWEGRRYGCDKSGSYGMREEKVIRVKGGRKGRVTREGKRKSKKGGM